MWWQSTKAGRAISDGGRNASDFPTTTTTKSIISQPYLDGAIELDSLRLKRFVQLGALPLQRRLGPFGDCLPGLAVLSLGA